MCQVLVRVKLETRWRFSHSPQPGCEYNIPYGTPWTLAGLGLVSDMNQVTEQPGEVKWCHIIVCFVQPPPVPCTLLSKLFILSFSNFSHSPIREWRKWVLSEYWPPNWTLFSHMVSHTWKHTHHHTKMAATAEKKKLMRH